VSEAEANWRRNAQSNDDELDAAAIEPPGDEHGLTVAGMEPIGDPTFNRLFVGIMSCV
jgi:hypothetical protein